MSFDLVLAVVEAAVPDNLDAEVVSARILDSHSFVGEVDKPVGADRLFVLASDVVLLHIQSLAA
jgi:hypothetical protein